MFVIYSPFKLVEYHAVETMEKDTNIQYFIINVIYKILQNQIYFTPYFSFHLGNNFFHLWNHSKQARSIAIVHLPQHLRQREISSRGCFERAYEMISISRSPEIQGDQHVD